MQTSAQHLERACADSVHLDIPVHFFKCRTLTSRSPTTHTHQLLPVVVTVFSTLLPDLSSARFILPSHTWWLKRLAKEIPSSDRRKIGDFHTSFLTNKNKQTFCLSVEKSDFCMGPNQKGPVEFLTKRIFGRYRFCMERMV